MKRFKPVLISVTFILALFIFIWGYNFLKGKDIFNKQTIFFAKYKDIGGLNVANPILINGLKVGQVSKIYFSPEMTGEIIVELMLEQPFPIPANSISRIYSADLMGSKAIDLKLGNAAVYAQSGDTLRSSSEASLKEEVNAQVQPIKMKAEELLSSIDSLVGAIQTIFNENARDNLKSSFDNIRLTFSNLENTTANIDTLIIVEGDRISSILRNVDSIAYTLNQNRASISNLLTNLEVFSDTLARTDISGTFRKANLSLDELQTILNQINSGKGTVGMLLHDDTLYMGLNKSAAELDLLLKDIKENPKKYLKFSVF